MNEDCLEKGKKIGKKHQKLFTTQGCGSFLLLNINL